MNDREKNVLAKLAEYNFCTNETKAVLHMLGGGDFRTVPVPDSSRERLITMLKKKRIIEKVQGRYVFTPEFAGVFNGGSVRDGKLVPSSAPRASAAPAEIPPPPAPAQAPAPLAVAAPIPAPAAQPALQAAPAPTPAALAVESAPVFARFPAFSPLAAAFLARGSAQQGDTLREWFARNLGEREGQVVLDTVSDLAAGLEPRHNVNLDKLLVQCERLAKQLFRQ